MSDEHEQHDAHHHVPRLSEEAAHRLLARAVELDTAREVEHGTALSLAQLREVAREAGIAASAFDAAVREMTEAHDAPAPRRDASRWRALRYVVARNALSLAGAWAIISLVSGVTNAAGAGWQVHHAAVGVATALAALLARRLDGRTVAVLAAAVAAGQLGEYPLHLVFGVESVQGDATKWALVLASLLGMAFGTLLGRGRRGDAGRAPGAPSAPVVDTPIVDAPVASDPPARAPAPARPPLGPLRLRHAVR